MLKRRLKLLLRVLLLLVGLVIAFLLFERWRGQIALVRFKRELAARGQTLDVSKLLAPPVADADNGAAELLRLEALIREGTVVPGTYPPKMKLISPGKAMLGFRENSWIDDGTTNDWEQVSLDLAANRETLEQIRAVLTKPAFDFKLDHSKGFDMNLPHLARARSICQWFGPACQNALHYGDNPAALQDLVAALAVPRVLERDHVVISELVRIVISSINFGTTWEALQSNAWTDEQLAVIEEAWQRNTFITNMIHGLEVERADGDTCFKRFRKSNEETYRAMFPNWTPFLTGDDTSNASHWWQCELIRKQIYCRVWRFAWSYQDEAFYLAGMDQFVHDRRTGAEKAARAAESVWLDLPIAKTPHQDFYSNWRFGISAQALATLSRATLKSSRAETERSMILCAIGLKRFLLRHGKPPADLNALVPEFLPLVPIDYMDNKPMKYRLKPDGSWILYSVGDNGRDDEGDPSVAEPGESRRGIWYGKDAVWPAPASPEEIASSAEGKSGR